MKILLTSPDQTTLTGQPMYVKNLAKGLRELGHDVTCSEHPQGVYDIAIINDNFPDALGKFTAKKIYNLCHSKNECDRPIIDSRITGYLAPREQISKHWQQTYRIPFEILPIPIDFNRWQIKKQKQDKYTILMPGTFDPQREAMIKDLILNRIKEAKIMLVGKDYIGIPYGVKGDLEIYPETDKIEDYMAKADEVAGIHIGTTTLEAWAMGLKTSVYDEQGNWEYVEKPQDFDKYNYLSVAKKLIEIALK